MNQLKFSDFCKFMNNSEDFKKELKETKTLGEVLSRNIDGSYENDEIPSYHEFEDFLLKETVDERIERLNYESSEDEGIDFTNELRCKVDSAVEGLNLPELLSLSKEGVSEPCPSNATFVLDEDEKHVKGIIDNMILKVESDMKNHSTILPACVCKMKKCYLKVPEKNRVVINERFFELEDYGRRLWIQNHVTAEEPKRRYSNETGSKRKFSRYFFLPDIDNQGSRISVCQIMFLRTLGYKSDEILRTVQNSSDEAAMVSKSKRGKYPPKHKILLDDEEFIREHIRKFNPCVSHYRRANAPNRLYLPSELTITEMYDDYKLCAEEISRKCYSFVKYWRVLKSLKISFATLGVEECEICDEHQIHIQGAKYANDDGTSIVRKKTKNVFRNKNEISCSDDCDTCNDYLLHVKRRDKSREEYKDDKIKATTDKETVFLSADLQKVILWV